MKTIFTTTVALVFLACASAHAQIFFIGENNDSLVTAVADTPSIFATGLSHPAGMAEDSRGNFYVANDESGTIFKYPLVNGTLSTTPVIFAQGLHGPMDLAFDRSGNLFEADMDSGTINKFIFNGAELSGTPKAVITGLDGNNEPIAICFDARGDLYVAALIGGILKFENNGTLSTTPTVFANISRARQLAFDKNGDLFTADHVDQRVYEFVNSPAGLSGKPQIFAERESLNGPEGIAFDSSGNLYVGNWGSGRGVDVVEFPVVGGVLSHAPVSFMDGLGDPSYIFFYTVPGSQK